MELSRPEYWSALPCPPPGDLPNPGIEPRSPILLADSLPSEPPGKPFHLLALGNIAAMNMDVYTNICLSPGSALLHMYSEEGLQHNGNSMFSLSRTHRAFPTAAALFYIPISSAQAFQCFYILILATFGVRWYLIVGFVFFFKKDRFLTFYLFTCFWLCCVFTAAPGSPGVDVGVLFAAVRGLLISVVSFVAEHGLQGMRAQSPPCRLSSAGSVVVAHCLTCSVTCGHLPGRG